MRYLSCGKHLYERTLPERAGGLPQMLDLVSVLFGKDFADAGERIDFFGSFVGPETHDTRKTKGVAAVVTAGTLNIVEGYFKDDGGLDAAAIAKVFRGVREEVASKLVNLDVGET